jgi:hypothetical protein
MIVTIDIKELWTEWTKKKLEVAEEVEEEDLLLTADPAHTTVEMILMTKEIRKEETEKLRNSTKEEEAEVRIASRRRETTPTQDPDHSLDQVQYTPKILLQDPQEVKLLKMEIKE